MLLCKHICTMKLPWTDYQHFVQKQLIKLLKEAIIHVLLCNKTNNIHDEILDYLIAELSISLCFPFLVTKYMPIFAIYT